MRKIFDQYDVDRSGFIDREELSKALTRLKVCPSDADISDFMKAADKDESGHLSFAEFSSTFTKAQLSSVFSELDVDGSGQIDVTELHTALKKLGYTDMGLTQTTKLLKKVVYTIYRWIRMLAAR